MFNRSYNLNRDLFWSRSPGNSNSSSNSSSTTAQSEPSTPGPGPTVALPPALYRERRGLAARGKQGSGQVLRLSFIYYVLIVYCKM